MALRGDLSIPPETTKKIRLAAEKMGYTPDPMLQALNAYRQTTKPPAEHAPLAWLSNASQSESAPDYLFAGYLAGARRRARQFGYRLDEFLLGTAEMTPARMNKILLTRGITGVLVAPQPHGWSDGMIDMDWSPFAAVTFGYSLTNPSLHLVTSHHVNVARLAVRRLVDLGYRRIGLYVGRVSNTRVAGGWLGGYAGEALGNPRLKWIDPFLHDGSNIPEFVEWVRAKRIDAVVTSGDFIDKVRVSGALRVPEELGMASLRLRPGDDDHSGVDQNDEEIGVTAVDSLLGVLRANARGTPEIRRCILIEGTWRDGRTAVPQIGIKSTSSSRK